MMWLALLTALCLADYEMELAPGIWIKRPESMRAIDEMRGLRIREIDETPPPIEPPPPPPVEPELAYYVAAVIINLEDCVNPFDERLYDIPPIQGSPVAMVNVADPNDTLPAWYNRKLAVLSFRTSRDRGGEYRLNVRQTNIESIKFKPYTPYEPNTVQIEWVWDAEYETWRANVTGNTE